jgi:hypothetical protein
LLKQDVVRASFPEAERREAGARAAEELAAK